MFKSAYEKTDGIVWFPRMLEKIRLNSKGELPEEYIPYLGAGFDNRCIQFLGVDYDQLVKRVMEGMTDDEIMDWCKEVGTNRSDHDKLVWNEYMIKRGWRDTDSSPDKFTDYKKQHGLGERDDILTFFDFYEVDEGRKK